ncbi:NFU1 iron-sulfur cluster scaffold-like, mitochondrial, partial [Fragariocoptes setiger]
MSTNMMNKFWPSLIVKIRPREIPPQGYSRNLSTSSHILNADLFTLQQHLRHGSVFQQIITLNKVKHNTITTTRANFMFIQVEETPNPNSLKFYPGETVLESGTADFQDKVSASMRSPLAKALFRIKGTKSVFFAQDFITVTKEDDDNIDWQVMKPQIFSAIMIFYTMKQPVLYQDASGESDPNVINENDSEIVKQIKELIEERIRPTILEDGGDLAFVSYDDGVVKVRLQGACTSCPSSIVTLRSGIKNMLQFYIPEVNDVEQVQ